MLVCCAVTAITAPPCSLSAHRVHPPCTRRHAPDQLPHYAILYHLQPRGGGPGELLLIIEVVHSYGKKDNIKIHEGDDPVELARAFVLQHNLVRAACCRRRPALWPTLQLVTLHSAFCQLPSEPDQPSPLT